MNLRASFHFTSCPLPASLDVTSDQLTAARDEFDRLHARYEAVTKEHAELVGRFEAYMEEATWFREILGFREEREERKAGHISQTSACTDVIHSFKYVCNQTRSIPVRLPPCPPPTPLPVIPRKLPVSQVVAFVEELSVIRGKCTNFEINHKMQVAALVKELPVVRKQRDDFEADHKTQVAALVEELRVVLEQRDDFEADHKMGVEELSAFRENRDALLAEPTKTQVAPVVEELHVVREQLDNHQFNKKPQATAPVEDAPVDRELYLFETQVLCLGEVICVVCALPHLTSCPLCALTCSIRSDLEYATTTRSQRKKYVFEKPADPVSHLCRYVCILPYHRMFSSAVINALRTHIGSAQDSSINVPGIYKYLGLFISRIVLAPGVLTPGSTPCASRSLLQMFPPARGHVCGLRRTSGCQGSRYAGPIPCQAGEEDIMRQRGPARVEVFLARWRGVRRHLRRSETNATDRASAHFARMIAFSVLRTVSVKNVFGNGQTRPVESSWIKDALHHTTIDSRPSGHLGKAGVLFVSVRPGTHVGGGRVSPLRQLEREILTGQHDETRASSHLVEPSSSLSEMMMPMFLVWFFSPPHERQSHHTLVAFTN
ncbi:hypothetical protein BDK51DRAFT_38084 [Blyttiomyces helicus]|uniref:Uncharacterized protein n=1 Tax=Blyttiomyces helicus TaxID=388810 RepID=A0A4V1IQ67_9FUNG|nr:hypothetical protein BDK51DRAFT_38084 [Blyttiomyces helicus]|eukprot:RKO85497.1 hypothetical protein BDK51DRAFT_38084 [Blyttiomyces helicus]